MVPAFSFQLKQDDSLSPRNPSKNSELFLALPIIEL